MIPSSYVPSHGFRSSDRKPLLFSAPENVTAAFRVEVEPLQPRQALCYLYQQRLD